MTEFESAALTIHRKQGNPPWVITGRPFQRFEHDYYEHNLRRIREIFGSWGNAEYVLGFSHEEIEAMRRKHLRVLEIGPGQGNSFKQLRDKGIDIYALEPSFSYIGDKNDPKPGRLGIAGMLEQAHKAMLVDRFQGRVKAAVAMDAPYAFPGISFDIAFAIGPNFQSFSGSPEELLYSIEGVIASLSIKKSSFVTFELQPDKLVGFDWHKRFKLLPLFDKHGIRYTTRPCLLAESGWLGEGMTESHALRVFRMDSNGEDSLPTFTKLPKDDLSQYIPTTNSNTRM